MRCANLFGTVLLLNDKLCYRVGIVGSIGRSTPQSIYVCTEASMTSDEVVISYGDAAIRPSDIDTLRPDEWVNDAIISFVYEVIDRHMGHQVGLWPSSVVELLSNLPFGEGEVQSMLPPMKPIMALPSM